MISFFDNINRAEDLINDLGLSERFVNLAWKRAVNRASRSFVRGAASEIGKKEVLRLRDIARRIKIFQKRNGDADISMVVFGIPAIFFNARQDNQGVRITGRRFPGSFIARSTRAGAKRNVFRRGFLNRAGKPPRFPIIVEKVELAEAAEIAFLKQEDGFFSALGKAFFDDLEAVLRLPNKLRIF